MFSNYNVDQNPLDNRSKTLNLLISTFKYQRKPKPENRGGIKASFFNPKYSLQSASLEELVTYISQGQSITPAFLLKVGPEKGPSKSSTFISQQLWMVDIDNHNDFDKKGNRRTPDENLCITNILTICQAIQCEPFIIYETFGSTRSLPRYRVALISSEPVSDFETRNRVAESFCSIFKSEFRYTDEKSKEVAQLFYGSSSDRIRHIDYDAVFDAQEFLRSYPVIIAPDASGKARHVRGTGLKPENRDAKASVQNPSNKTTNTQHAYITWVMKQSDTYVRSQMFKSEFRYTDENSIEVARLFYGSSSDRIRHIDYNVVFDTHALLRSCAIIANYEVSSIDITVKPENRDAKELLQNPSNKHNNKTKYAYITWGMKKLDTDARYIESNRVPWDHLTRYRTGEKFHCQFHEDAAPSAEIISVDRGAGTEYFYCCLGEGCEHRMLSQVEYLHETQKITKTTALKKVLGCREEVQPLCELLDELKTVRNDYPDESRSWRFAVTNSDKILHIFVEAAIENSIVVGDTVRFPLAESMICAELNKRNVPGRSPEAVHRKVKDFECYGFLIRGLSDGEMGAIPGALDYFVEEQEQQGRARHCKWWEMPLMPDLGECIRAATRRLRADKQQGKRGCITREAVLMRQGTEEADRLFSQDIGREVSKVTVNLYHVAKLVLRGFLNTYGWTQEWRILDFLAGNWTYEGFTCFMGKERKKQKLREIWPRLLEDLDAEFRVINSGLRERFSIPDSMNQGTKIVYRRIEKVQTYRPYPDRLDLNIPDPVDYAENGVQPFKGTLRDRTKLHVDYQAGELQRLDTRMQLEIFEESKCERIEQRERKRREVRELVIPGDIEEFDRLLRSQYGHSVQTEAAVDEIK
jgi:hypothetical protein